MSSRKDWQPRGILPWALTMAAGLLAALMVLIAAYMLHPVDYDTLPGKLALAVLVFPLHLLAVTALAGMLAVLAWRTDARLAAALASLVTGLTALMALAPSLAMWQFARQQNMPFLLPVYFAEALQPNFGGPQPGRTVEYGIAPDGTKLVLDHWRSLAGGNMHPAVVRVHGGAWIAGARGELGAWNTWLNELGFDVFDIEYRMPPPERWMDEVADVKCALGWVAANAARLGIDPARISTMGYSAGGHLAMLAAYSMGDPRLPPSCNARDVPIKAVVNFYGPVDLVEAYNDSPSLRFARNALHQFIGGPLAQVPERYRLASPNAYISAKAPPTITLLGTHDRIVPVRQAQILDQALAQAGVARETYLLPATDHGFDVNWGGFATQFAREKIMLFLHKNG